MRFLIVVGLFLACVAPAAAATEICGAEPSNVVKVSDTLYGYVLAGLAPRVVTGHLGVYTGTTAGYLTPFENVELKRTLHQTYTHSGQEYLKYVDYESAPQYFTLPKAETVQDAWVDDVDFAGHAHAGCQISPYDVEAERNGLKETGAATNDQIIASAPRSGPVAFERDMPGPGTCGKRYVPATLVQAAHVEYPPAMASSYNGPVSVVSKVLLDKDSNIIDAWLFGGSGFAPFDTPGLRAAAQAKYRTAQFLCKPVPSLYYFIQSFAM
ncbi:MAG: hypothetical protein GIW97_05640 [Candidatus Eremiobacteraeota bacterium]|nr:hypothetical protein [Candidatus Eremiobacteraeota bacterium]